MTEIEYEKFIEILDTLSPSKQISFLTAVRLFLACCTDNSDASAVLIVRLPIENSLVPEWTINVSALNADKDDAYELLDIAYNRIAADIAKEAPDRARYN
jgi:hypothetical protein